MDITQEKGGKEKSGNVDFTAKEVGRFIDALPDEYLVVTYGEEGLRLAAASSAAYRIFGMAEEEFSRYIGTDALGLILPSDRDAVTKSVLNGFGDRRPRECVYREIHKTRGYVWVHVRWSYPGTLEGKPVCFASLNGIEAENQPYEEILDNSPYAVCVVDKSNGNVLYVNREFCALARRPKEGCVGLSVYEITGKREGLPSSLFLGKTYTYTVPDDGRIVDIKAIESKWGLHDVLIVLLADVTEERKQAMESAQAAREHLDAIMRMNPDALSTFRFNLTKDTFSDNVSVYPRLIGAQKARCIDEYTERIVTFFPFEKEKKEFCEKFSRENLIRAFEAGFVEVSMPHHYMLSEGEHRVLKTSVNMVRNKFTGDIEGVAYMLDSTRESYYRQINRLLFDNAHIGIMVVNAENGFAVIPQESSILGLPASYKERDYRGFIAEIAEKYVVKEERDKFVREGELSAVIRGLDAKDRYTFDTVWNNGGKEQNVLFSYYYMDGSKEQILLAAEDVTEAARREQEQVARYRRAVAQLEKANHAKSDFLSNVSHDMRTPLNAILNLSELLHEELDTPEKLEEDVQKIEVAGEFLLQLINDVLDVSAIESGRLTLKPGVYTYSTFLNYIKGIIVPLCRDKDVTFVLDEGPTALDIYIDRVRFHQVFFNILSNAVKYTPPGGTVALRTTNNVVHDGILTCDFIVSDTGCGMSDNFIRRAFEPFEREDNGGAYVGTGLGLTICKRILDMMGGTISIESKRGKGTTVTVHMDLPIATEEQRARSRVELETSYRQSVPLKATEAGRILVVEDNEMNREILTRLLEKKGYLVDCAVNGKEAVDKIRSYDERRYQVVLMDVRMPVMNGLEATALIRKEKNEQKRRLPIVAITANAFDEDANECLAAGMNAFLSKPISPGALYQMLATYIEVDD